MKLNQSLFLTVLLLSIFSEENSAINIPDQKQPLKWEVGFKKTAESAPNEWFTAIVPGAVQLDYARANNWPTLYYAENWKEYGWMEDVFWTYKTSFKKPDLGEGEQLFFVSKGIDYEFEIYLNLVCDGAQLVLQRTLANSRQQQFNQLPCKT